MHVSKNELPIKIDAPGAHARHQRDFGTSTGELAAEYFTMGAGADLAPLLEGLEHDTCHSAHWGYMVAGEVVVTYRDASEEHCTSGDLFYWQPGHSVRVIADAELAMFSPQAEHTPVLDHIVAKMAGG